MLLVADLIMAIALFLPTTVFISSPYILISLVVAVFIYILNNDLKISQKELLFFLLILGCSLAAIGLSIFYAQPLDATSGSVTNWFPYLPMIMVSAIIAKSCSERVMKLIIVFILIEVFVGILEYLVGVRSFFVTSYGGVTEFGSTDYFYYNRVFGLSENSSAFAIKCLFAFCLIRLFQNNINRLFFLISIGVISLGFLITFNRTVIVALLFAVFIFYGKKFYRSIWMFVFIGFSLILFVYNFDYIREQFFRGKDGFDPSGRWNIFSAFFEFIAENTLFGNMGIKHWVMLGDRMFHAHNSYIEFLASNGIIISIFFLLSLLVVINKKSIVIVAPLLLLSVFQYGIFWGASFYDVVFFYVIFHCIRDAYQPPSIFSSHGLIRPLAKSE